ncbi:MAG TPA: TlpA disulfide reductase family protein [Pedobacter sp.]|nr:TlpA disulfide reductase family protein [Pedobacter sp.]
MKHLSTGISILFLFLIYPFESALSQLTIAKNHAVLTMTSSIGMKPGTVSSTQIAQRLQMATSEEKKYPEMTGKPNDISNQIEYYYVVDRFQFAFQNYCEGNYTRGQFLEDVKNNFWILADTIHLSRKPIRCGFSVLGGIQADSIPVYIVDANNNNDYSDEVVRTIRKMIIKSDTIINLSVPVTIDYFLDKKIKQETINCYISSTSPENQLANLSFCFPAFRYNSFIFNGKPYIIWTPVESYQDELYLQTGKSGVPVPDKINPIKPGQYVTLEEKPYKLIRFEGNRHSIVLEGDGYTGFEAKTPSKPAYSKGGNADFRSSQVGFKAPQIQGIKVTDPDEQTTVVSLDKLRGKYVFIDFWSTTCIPCIADFPEIMKSYKKYGREQLEIIGVVDERSAGGAINLLKKHGITWPNIKTNTSGTVISGYEVVSYPTTYLLDQNGKIIAQNIRGEELLKKLATLIK